MQKKRYIFPKRLFDISLSVVVLVFVLSWLTPIVAICIFLESKEFPFYSQIRIGKRGVPFKIFKFRSMKGVSPVNDPLLSKDEIARITKFGHFLRKFRIDEFPQFYNVLKNDMSIVGPRPERQVFLDEIIKHIPRYKQLQNLKPGISSLGQIKYGYADSLNEMLIRAKYDLIYLNNLSFWTDIKVVLSTIKIVFEGKGK